MTKKSFKGIDALLAPSLEEKTAPNTEILKNTKKKEEIRTSLTIEIEILEQLHALSYWERKSLKETWKEAIDIYLSTKNTKYLDDAMKHYNANKKS